MKLSYKKEHTVVDTIDEMKRLINTYYGDMKEFATMDTLTFFNWLANFPYRKDPDNIEYVMRPSLIILRGSCDCDEKTIMALAWGKCRGLTGGLSIVSKKAHESFCHVFPYFYLSDGTRQDFDATYKYFKLTDRRPFGKRVDFEVV
jgi:hypothetical protein